MCIFLQEIYFFFSHLLFFHETNLNLNIITNISWRTIDIDQYDEDAYTQDEFLAEFETGLSPEQVASATQTRSTDVRNLLTR